MKKSTIIIALFVLVGIGIIIFGGIYIFSWNRNRSINDFETCARYYPVQESFPERCSTPDGRSFTKPVSGVDIEVEGDLTCLPPRKGVDAVPAICMYGIKTIDNKYYSLNDEKSDSILNNSFGSRVKVKGKLDTTKPTDTVFESIGVITVESIIKL